MIPKIKFVYDRRKKASESKKAVVELRVTHEYNRIFMSTGISLYPHQWDAKTETVKQCVTAFEHNKLLSEIKHSVMKIIWQMVEEKSIDIARIPKHLKSCQSGMTFIDYIEQRSDDKDVKLTTKRRYKVFADFLRDWKIVTYFSDITESNIRKMDSYLRKQGLKQSTIHDYHKRMKQFINDAVVDGFLRENVYTTRRIKIDRGEKDHVDCITEEQFRRLLETKFTEPFLDRVKDLFLFQCYTGMAYCDMMNFDINELRRDKNGVAFGVLHRQKTGTAYYITILPQVERILEKYSYSLPRISNVKYNLYLKIVGHTIGVNNLHSHMGRATFSTIMLNHGASLEIIQKMVGHSDISQTQRYARMREDTVKSTFLELGKTF